MCTKKVIPTERQAKIAVDKMKSKYGNLFKYYWCNKCSGYHTAHSVPREKMKELMAKMGREYTQ